MLKTALLLLTLNEAGDVRLTLTGAEDRADCEAKAEVVVQVLEASGTKVIETRCGETALTLTPFDHGATAEDETWHYRVDLDAAGGFAVTPTEAGACEAGAEGESYCTVSSQSPLGG